MKIITKYICYKYVNCYRLKHITNGYWVLVKEFTPKTTVKEIDRLANVTTNLGKGMYKFTL